MFQMWMSARSLLSPHASISVSILWAPTAVSATLDTSCQDIAALVSELTINTSTGYTEFTKVMELSNQD